MRISIKLSGATGADLTSLPFELEDLVAALKAGQPFEIKAMCDDHHSARIGLAHGDLDHHRGHIGTMRIFLGGWLR